jgi:hypothetical protein
MENNDMPIASPLETEGRIDEYLRDVTTQYVDEALLESRDHWVVVERNPAIRSNRSLMFDHCSGLFVSIGAQATCR